MKQSYIDLVYNWKSEFASIMDLQLRKEQVATKLGISIPTGVIHEKEVITYLTAQAPYRYRLLISRMELLDEMLISLKSQPKRTTDSEEADLLHIKKKGEIDALCGRLVDDIERDFKTIYQELAEVAKEQVKKVTSPEERLRKKV